MLESGATLVPVKDAWMFFPSVPLGIRGKAFQGDGFFTAPNPPFGAVFTYFLAEEIQTLKKARLENEKKAREEGEDVFYPAWEELQAEDREEDPVILFTVADEEGRVVRRVTGPVGKGFHRVAWDLRYPASEPVNLSPKPPGPFGEGPMGPMVASGSYTVQMSKRVRGEVTDLGAPMTFRTTPLGTASAPAAYRDEIVAFQKKTAELYRAVLGSNRALSEAMTRVKHLKKAIDDTPGAPAALAGQVRALESAFKDVKLELTGNATVASRKEPTAPSILGRVSRIVMGQWSSSSRPTGTNQDAYRFTAEAFRPLLANLRKLVEEDLAKLEADVEAAGGPWTPGRLPRF
jgi:hypothetical protein